MTDLPVCAMSESTHEAFCDTELDVSTAKPACTSQATPKRALQRREKSKTNNPPEKDKQKKNSKDEDDAQLFRAFLFIDHMRSRRKYLGLIKKWAKQLKLTGRLWIVRSVLVWPPDPFICTCLLDRIERHAW